MLDFFATVLNDFYLSILKLMLIHVVEEESRRAVQFAVFITMNCV
jgi:hypothetical protein